MDVILTIDSSGNRDNKTYLLCPTLQTRTCIGVLKSIIMFFQSLIAMEYAFTLFFSYCKGHPLFFLRLASSDRPKFMAFTKKMSIVTA